jgi:hypothetical protein
MICGTYGQDRRALVERLVVDLRGCRPDSHVAARRTYLQRLRQARKLHATVVYDDRDDADAAAHDLAEDLVAAETRAILEFSRVDLAEHHAVVAELTGSRRPDEPTYRASAEPPRSPLAAHAPPVALLAEG